MKTDVLTRIPSSIGVHISHFKNYNRRYIDYAIYLRSELGEQSSVGHRTDVPFAHISIIEQSSKLYIDAVQYVDIAVCGLFR